MGGAVAPAVERPATPAATAQALRAAAAAGAAVRIRGGGTKLTWGRPTPAADVELDTRGLDALVEHNAGDLTAVVQAGVPLAGLQRELAGHGQMLALDPPGAVATVGGVVATGDSGPLRHRYGAPRDLVLGVTVALPDGTVAKAGGKVIKNVAGYDLAKLHCGAFGTLGAVVQVALRLHPLPRSAATVVGHGDDPRALAAAALTLARAPLELVSLDVRWEEGRGAVLARGTAPGLAERVRATGLEVEEVEDDAELWIRQRAGQRSADATVVRVSGLPTQLEEVLRCSQRLGARVVGRAGLGTSWLTLPTDATPATVAEVRGELRPAPCVVLDAPPAVREALDPWDEKAGVAADLLRRVKERFDPPGTCNPGIFLAGI